VGIRTRAALPRNGARRAEYRWYSSDEQRPEERWRASLLAS